VSSQSTRYGPLANRGATDGFEDGDMEAGTRTNRFWRYDGAMSRYVPTKLKPRVETKESSDQCRGSATPQPQLSSSPFAKLGTPTTVYCVSTVYRLLRTVYRLTLHAKSAFRTTPRIRLVFQSFLTSLKVGGQWFRVARPLRLVLLRQTRNTNSMPQTATRNRRIGYTVSEACSPTQPQK
jgi:hypothetical protein